MCMPGFTGDASLYKTSGHHHITAVDYSSLSAQVLPQIPLGPTTKCRSCTRDADSPTGFSRTCCTDGDCESKPCTLGGGSGGGGGGGGGTGGGCTPLFPSGSGLPIYGNYCGPGHGDPTYMTPPVDAVDAVCMAHDMCYDTFGYFNCACDRALIAGMPAAIAASPCLSGKTAGAAAMTYFAGATCFCPTTVCLPFGGPCFSVPVPGRGGIGIC